MENIWKHEEEEEKMTRIILLPLNWNLGATKIEETFSFFVLVVVTSVYHQQKNIGIPLLQDHFKT